MIPLLKVHEYYGLHYRHEYYEIVTNDRLEKRIVNNNRLERIENIIEKHYSLRRNRYGYPLSNEKV